MKMLSSEITKLLDKLYNLRGEDSVVLAKMEEERVEAEETRERTTEEKATLQEKITRLDEEERVLGEEGEKLVSALSGIRADDFRTVLDKLHIDFNPDELSNKINSLLPETISEVKGEKEDAKNELSSVEGEMNTAIATIEELAIRKDEAVSNQARLNEFFNMALNGNINITRDSITSLLEKFDFNEDEQREAAKILMFPEDALYDYEENLKEVNESGKSITEVLTEAKETTDEIEYKEEVREEEKKEVISPREELINLLTELGFDYLDFTSSDLDKILANYNELNLRENVSYAIENGIKLDIFVDNIELLYDKEFRSKVNKLLEIGKDVFDIYLNPSILVKYNKEDLDNTINRLIDSGLDPKQVPLIAY